MTNEEARKILETLVMGSNPVNGEELPENHVLSQAPVIRALCMGIRALKLEDDLEAIRRCAEEEEKKRATTVTARKIQPSEEMLFAPQSVSVPRRGRMWTEAEIDSLRQMCERKMPEEKMVRRTGRSAKSVQRMLRWLEREEKGQLTDGQEKAGIPWTQEDHRQLEKLFEERTPIYEIARELRRSEYAVFCRMEQYGLCADVEGYPHPDENEMLWCPADNRKLREMAKEGKSLSEIAAYFDRSEESMKARMICMGLSGEVPQ